MVSGDSQAYLSRLTRKKLQKLNFKKRRTCALPQIGTCKLAFVDIKLVLMVIIT